MNTADMAEIAAMHRFVAENVTASDGRRLMHYRELCGVYCNDSNSIVLGFIQVMIGYSRDLPTWEIP
jgi:hypothetical protein